MKTEDSNAAFVKEIARKIGAGEKTTFAERNILNIYKKKLKKKK